MLKFDYLPDLETNIPSDIKMSFFMQLDILLVSIAHFNIKKRSLKIVSNIFFQKLLLV